MGKGIVEVVWQMLTSLGGGGEGESIQPNSIGLVLQCYLESPTHRIIHEILKSYRAD